MDAGEFELELTTMAHGGLAMGRHEGRAVFMPWAIPGERVAARLRERRGRVDFAGGLRLLEASADRVFPRCPHFGPGRCLGCQWQHIAYPAQLLLKQDVLADQLARVGGFGEVTLRPTLPAPSPWNYNWRLELRADEAGTPGLARDGGGALPPQICHIAHPELLALHDSLSLPVPGLRNLQLLRGSDGARMLVLNMEADRPPELHADMPASINMLLAGGEPVNLIGASHLRYAIGGRMFRVTAGGDFRPHVAMLPTLLAQLRAMLAPEPGAKILDLYGGMGFFSAFLARTAGLVTLVERHPPALGDAESNLADHDNVDLIEGEVAEVLRGLGERHGLAVLDPPRAGLERATVDALGASGVSRLVYVSSDAATLARDARRLVNQGWQLEEVRPLDLAPQTWRIDSLALLTRDA